MTEAPLTLAPGAPRAPRTHSDTTIIAAVSSAHFVAHYCLLALPPLLEIVRADFGVSYTELGFALVAFNVLCAAFQTPAGFLVDRIGARKVLIAGMVLGAMALAAAGLATSFWLFVALFALGGLGNAVYHPADYAVLSTRVGEARVGHAYAMHQFAGMLGGAAAPVAMLAMHHAIGWRGAFVASALPGLAVAVWFVLLGESAMARPAGAPAERETKNAREGTDASAPDAAGGGSMRLLMSPVILANFVFFMLFATLQAGMQNYGAVALTGAQGMPLTTANGGLTGYLLAISIGVLLGGAPARWIGPARLTTITMLTISALSVVLALVDLGPVGAIAVMSVIGLVAGVSMPSRDLIVREVTPPGTFGKVFGFVTTGFNLAGILAPIVFGLLLDHGHASGVFLVVAGACLLAIATVATVRSRS
ncbi:MFS transporter [Rhodovulum sp. PH10]|uniref:MFS transporter n=1 Tax=Rhodovulum sp. PH10 TaxID=1187851 RepID=UPI00068A2A1C|nr:MFS transporter [Rhodovulum sp. PH10]